MGNVIRFPGSPVEPRGVIVAWHTYRVEATDAMRDHHSLMYRAMSPDSARRRAQMDGYTVKSVTKENPE